MRVLFPSIVSPFKMATTTTNLMLDILSGAKNINDCDDLKSLPLDFFLNYVDCMSLLDIWGRLPVDYRRNFELQVRLPCFVHYNRPD